MALSPFTITVQGEGAFTFAPRTVGVGIKIAVEYGRLTEGEAGVDDDVARLCDALAELKVRTISAPEGWEPEEMDGFDPEAYARIIKVWEALQEKERTFRGRTEALGVQASRA